MVTVIIVLYDSERFFSDIVKNIRTLRDEICEDLSVVIVDNKRSDEVDSLILRLGNDVTYISNERNLGFGGACNLGIRAAKSEFVFFLNPDVKEIFGFDNLLQIIKEDDSVGAVGPKVLYPGGVLQRSCGRELRASRLVLNWIFGSLDVSFGALFYQKSNSVYTELRQEVGWVSGCALLARKSMLDMISGFDERYFMYLEDADLCGRALGCGYKVIYSASCSVVHIEGSSEERVMPPHAIEYYLGSSLIFLKGSEGAVLWVPLFRVIMLAKFLQTCLGFMSGSVKPRLQRARAFLSAWRRESIL